MTKGVLTNSPSSPTTTLLQMMTGHWVMQAIYVAAKLGIADLLAKGPVSCEDLAVRTNTHERSLHRVLRALASIGIFSEVTASHFANTPLADLLRSETPDSMRALAMLYAEESYRAWGDMLHSVRTGQSAFEHQFGMGVFEFFAKHPEAAAIFNAAMTALMTQTADAVAGSYDFSVFHTVVDVGGNQGTLLAAILKSYPSLRGMLFDLPHVVANAGPVLTNAGVEHRCARLGGDFFVRIPAGGDVYVLASVLHDWDDDRCAAILRACREVVPLQGKLLIVEMVLPPKNEPFFGKWVDLHMLVMANGFERTAEDYATLLRAAGFELARLVPMTAGRSILEAVPAQTRQRHGVGVQRRNESPSPPTAS